MTLSSSMSISEITSNKSKKNRTSWTSLILSLETSLEKIKMKKVNLKSLSTVFPKLINSNLTTLTSSSSNHQNPQNHPPSKSKFANLKPICLNCKKITKHKMTSMKLNTQWVFTNSKFNPDTMVLIMKLVFSSIGWIHLKSQWKNSRKQICLSYPNQDFKSKYLRLKVTMIAKQKIFITEIEWSLMNKIVAQFSVVR